MGKVKVLKKDVDLKFFLNKKLNSFWEFDNKLQAYSEIQASRFFKEDLLDGEVFDYSNTKIIDANNKEIFSSTVEERKAKSENVLSLKESGLEGHQIVSNLIESNVSIHKRTLMSQEKIIKKYEMRHNYQCFLAKPTLFNITEALFNDKIQSKVILHMRFDTVGTILQSMKFINKSKSLIFEQTNGFLTAAIVARTSNLMYSLYEDKPIQRIMSFFNYPKELKNKITYFDIGAFTELMYNEMFGFNNAFTNLVICCKDETKLIEITFKLLPALKKSGIFIAYARDKEYLVLLERILFENKILIGISINETYLREYQILPLRTHPMMNNKGFSNYVLVGYKV